MQISHLQQWAGQEMKTTVDTMNENLDEIVTFYINYIIALHIYKYKILYLLNRHFGQKQSQQQQLRVLSILFLLSAVEIN